MLLTLLSQPALTLNAIMMTALLFAQTALPQSAGSSIVETALANGSIGAVLFVIWYLTFRSTQKQFEFALKQNQEQFEKALVQIENQHKDNLNLNQKTVDRLFGVMDKDAEYKEILTGVLTEMKNALTTIQLNTGGSK